MREEEGLVNMSRMEGLGMVDMDGIKGLGLADSGYVLEVRRSVCYTLKG